MRLCALPLSWGVFPICCVFRLGNRIVVEATHLSAFPPPPLTLNPTIPPPSLKKIFFCRPLDRSPRRREPVLEHEKTGEGRRGAAEDVAFRLAIGVALAPAN